jgi:hypothetical protein
MAPSVKLNVPLATRLLVVLKNTVVALFLLMVMLFSVKLAGRLSTVCPFTKATVPRSD